MSIHARRGEGRRRRRRRRRRRSGEHAAAGLGYLRHTQITPPLPSVKPENVLPPLLHQPPAPNNLVLPWGGGGGGGASCLGEVEEAGGLPVFPSWREKETPSFSSRAATQSCSKASPPQPLSHSLPLSPSLSLPVSPSLSPSLSLPVSPSLSPSLSLSWLVLPHFQTGSAWMKVRGVGFSCSPFNC